MQVKCEYCDNYIDDVAEQCPFCGAPNLNKVRAADRIPRTIAELQAFCAEHNLNLEKMHFHIGEDYRGPRAFGIYEENGRYIVYKNKSDGSRAVRYNGTDEPYAVNEIYQKMKAELNEVRAISAERGTSGVRGAKAKTKRAAPNLSGIIGSVIAILVLAFPFVITIGSCVYDAFNPTPDRGYYTYDDDTYYYGNRGWYYYDEDAGDWVFGDVPEGLSDDPSGYWSSSDYDDDYDVPSFSTSDSWDSDNNWDDDWDDDDWDWDSGWDSGSSSDWDSWDSGYDWDSDW